MGRGNGARIPEPRRPLEELTAHLAEVTGEAIDPALIRRALTHRSYAYEAGGLPHNERLEFLGDSVLGLIVTDTLYRAHPDVPEGQLAKLRAAVVNMRALADVGRTLGLGDYLLLGRGEEATGGRDKHSILADTVEAVIGAVYIGAGAAAAELLVHELLDPVIAASAQLGAGLDWKTSLQEAASSRGLGIPEYRISESGPEHRKTFDAEALLGERVWGVGHGGTKKDAEQQAAARAHEAINRELPAGDGA